MRKTELETAQGCITHRVERKFLASKGEADRVNLDGSLSKFVAYHGHRINCVPDVQFNSSGIYAGTRGDLGIGEVVDTVQKEGRTRERPNELNGEP